MFLGQAGILGEYAERQTIPKTQMILWNFPPARRLRVNSLKLSLRCEREPISTVPVAQGCCDWLSYDHVTYSTHAGSQ